MEKSIFEKTGGTYIKVGDYLIPDLGQDEKLAPIGKYGRLRRKYLQEHRHALYNHLVLSGKLHEHLLDIENQAQNRLSIMIPQLKHARGVTEQLKSQNQMEWVGRMNNIISQIEEIIYADIVYS